MKAKGREAGDRLGLPVRSLLVSPDAPCHPCFASLLQGDAAGVEIATAAHAGFLETHGILPPAEEGRLLARHPVALTNLWTGLVMDDLYAISVESASNPPVRSASEDLIRKAKAAYQREGLPGSDDKDIFGAPVFCVSRAEVDSSAQTVKDGFVSVQPLQRKGSP